jgi:hypothetical protein
VRAHERANFWFVFFWFYLSEYRPLPLAHSIAGDRGNFQVMKSILNAVGFV